MGCKNGKFHWKKYNVFIVFAQNIDCGYKLEPPRRGGSNEHPQSMFWSKNKKNRYTPAYPNFDIQKWGVRGHSFHGHVCMMEDNHFIQTDDGLKPFGGIVFHKHIKFLLSKL